MFLRSIAGYPGDIHGIGSVTAKKLERLGIHGVAGLLTHYPRDWDDRCKKNPISGYQSGRVNTEVTVIAKDWIGFGRTRTPKIYVEDESSRAALLCFNRSWLEKYLKTGSRYRLWGRFYYKYGEIQSGSFEFESIDSASGFFGSILPVYPLCAGLTQDMMRRYVSQALKEFAGKLENELPDRIIKRDNLLSKSAAINTIHFPSSERELELAKKTLIYEELFYLEIMVGKRAIERRGRKRTHRQPGFSPLQKRLIERLPFALTAGQQNAIAEINCDMMDAGSSMARLLQGDVGSGKTLVSFLAALAAVENGGQAAIMAPTELLARQHAENAARLLEPLGVRIAFLTGNIKTAGRKELLANLLSGEIDIVVGTHALFSKDVQYKNLRFVVIDEQHRFGVTQRSLIMAKGDTPALLMMSATPIPRSLALTVFGDMDVSVIRDMPAGRLPVKTHVAKESNEGKVYDFVRKQLALGRQAYFVYPLIEDGDEIKDAVSMASRLSKEVFPQFSVALVHSKLDEEEKLKAMEGFRDGKIKILAATSVVEVGVDVPNATCMVIEHCERFGLSALHQLRGRVGRGREQSYCFLVYSEELTDEGKARLKIMLENSDGFIIAEEDLKMRGPGIITGTEQSGYFVLGLANPLRDLEELVRARTDAFDILENDPDLLLKDNRIIAEVMEKAPPFGEIAL
ncbi:MAG: ATP-dependent DNA helicase RecG [Treponema sp.]|nr:ATP-dependent DNA helicase RecG [Treponema sp.]